MMQNEIRGTKTVIGLWPDTLGAYPACDWTLKRLSQRDEDNDAPVRTRALPKMPGIGFCVKPACFT